MLGVASGVDLPAGKKTHDRVFAFCADKPALGIIAHTRKPQLNEKRTGGTGLMHLLAGSYILTSVPRCIFVMTTESSVSSWLPRVITKIQRGTLVKM